MVSKGGDKFGLSDEDLNLLRELEALHRRGEIHTTIHDLDKDRDTKRLCVGLSRLEQFHLIHDNDFIRISERGLKFLHNLDNPPPKDYWADITVWFKSKWWSIPFFVLIVVIPLIVSWIEITGWIVELLTTPSPQ